jgi:hypothetical protein
MNLLAQLDLEKIQTGAFPSASPLASMTPGGFISNLLPYIFGIAGIALLIFMIIGGLQMMLSHGDPKAMQSAQAKITNALIGFVIIIIAFFIVQLIGQLLGLGLTGFGNIFGSGGNNDYPSYY